MKLLTLVIYSENLPVYTEHLKGWRLYSKSNSSVDVYFITLSSKYDKPTLVDDILYIPGEESFKNMPHKFISALEFFNYTGYNFILRTNMSSFWVFYNLLISLESLPKENILAGEKLGGFISGTGMIFSPDVCKILVKYKDRVNRFRPNDPGDDVRLSEYLVIHHDIDLVQLYPHKYDIVFPNNGTEDLISNDIVHFYLRQENRDHRIHEFQMINNLYKKFYLKS